MDKEQTGSCCLFVKNGIFMEFLIIYISDFHLKYDSQHECLLWDDWGAYGIQNVLTNYTCKS